eukprot:3310861-Prymnesium_polylepis.1
MADRRTTVALAAGATLAAAAALLLWHRRRRGGGRQLTLAWCWKYDLHRTRGFEPGPIARRLPARYAAWERVAASLPTLNRSGRLRAA